MEIIEYFSERNRVSMTGVWKDVYNIYAQLQIESTPQNHAKGKSWYNIKVDKFLFINIVKNLYDQLNTPNSMSLVKELFDQLEVNKIDIEKFTLKKNTGEIVLVDVNWREYLKNIVFGALYYVLYTTRKELKDPSVVEIVKQVALYKGNPNPHYFEYFEDRLPNDTQSTIEDQTIESESQPKPSIPNYSEIEKKQLFQHIQSFQKWLDQEAKSLRELKDRGLLPCDNFLYDFAFADECLDKCKKLLGVDISNIEPDLEVTSISIDSIRRFIFEKFPFYHEEYNHRYSYSITFTPQPQNIKDVEIVEEAKDIAQPSPQPTQAPPTRTLESFAKMFTYNYCERRKNDFENMLALIQEPQWEPKDRARFALAIHQSGNLVPKTKPKTFKEWYLICCETFGWEQGNYEPRKLTDNKATQQIKAYL